jgi:hypothetical protein
MNKRQILASLNKIANKLDKTGLIQEANSITNIMTRLADETKVKRELELLSSPWEHHKEKSYNPENRDEDDTYFFTDHATGDKYYQNPLGGTNFLTQDHYVNLKKMNELFGMFWKAMPWSLSKKLDELAKYRESRSLKERQSRLFSSFEIFFDNLAYDLTLIPAHVHYFRIAKAAHIPAQLETVLFNSLYLFFITLA